MICIYWHILNLMSHANFFRRNFCDSACILNFYSIIEGFYLFADLTTMFLNRSEYDRGPNTFSPEGRLFQVVQ